MSHGPELLDMMRNGAASHGPARRSSSTTEPKPSRRSSAGASASGAIPLIPQGILATVFVANGPLHHSWFLATYMPAGAALAAASSFLLGLTMYGLGLWIPARYRKVA